jgi:hypothetical protein
MPFFPKEKMAVGPNEAAGGEAPFASWSDGAAP